MIQGAQLGFWTDFSCNFERFCGLVCVIFDNIWIIWCFKMGSYRVDIESLECPRNFLLLSVYEGRCGTPTHHNLAICGIFGRNLLLGHIQNIRNSLVYRLNVIWIIFGPLRTYCWHFYNPRRSLASNSDNPVSFSFMSSILMTHVWGHTCACGWLGGLLTGGSSDHRLCFWL